MNLLQLTQRTMQECGVSGTITTTAALPANQQRILTWVQQGWTELQTKHDDWGWLRSSALVGAGASFTTVAGTPYYSLGTGAGTVGIPSTSFARWDEDSFRCYLTSVGFTNETRLDPVSYDDWREGYMYGAQRSVQTRPVAVAIGPNRQVCLGPPPNALYTITGDFFMAPSQMAADTDTPTGLPDRFHMAIVYKAMMYYAGFESAPEVYDRGSAGWDSLTSEMEAQWLPPMSFAGALA